MRTCLSIVFLCLILVGCQRTEPAAPVATNEVEVVDSDASSGVREVNQFEFVEAQTVAQREEMRVDSSHVVHDDDESENDLKPITLSPNKMKDALQYLREFTTAQNAEQTRVHTDYYSYLVEADKTDGDTLEEHLKQFGIVFPEPSKATAEQIAALEKKTGVTLPPDLAAFYREMGEFSGQDVSQSLVCRIPSCRSLLASLQSDRNDERLDSMGLPDGIRRSWGNSRPELTRGTGLPAEKHDQLSASYKWFGSLSDGGFESGLHFTFDNEGRYCLFFWHQDQPSDLKPNVTYDGTLAELLKHCVEGYLKVREVEPAEEEGEQPSVYFDLEELVSFLEVELK